MLICKRCNHADNFIRKGIKNGNQTYKCKECGSRKYPIDTDKEPDVDVLEENVKLAKSKQRFQDTNRIERKSFRTLARLENAVTEYVKEIRDIVGEMEIVSTIEHDVKNPNAMIVHLSDAHFNELVNTMGNKYDFTVASKRLYKFADRIKTYAKSNNINNIFLVMTGDMLNSDRRTDELLSMATNRAMATCLSVKLLIQFITDINKYANVNIISVSGNESRIREEYTNIDDMVTDNFDFMIYEMLKMYLEFCNGINFINGDTDEYVFKINGTTFLITHGMYLRGMKVADISKCVDRFSQDGVNINYILCGHLHETKIKDKLLRCGSLVGANDYSNKGLNLHSRASQNIHFIHESGDVDSMRIDLQDVEDDNSFMYNIDEELVAYHAKSADKNKKKVIIHEVVV